MTRPDLLRRLAFFALAGAVVAGALLLQVRVRIAGFKYLLLLAAVIAVAAWIARVRR